MTPQLQQAIRLLQLSSLELQSEIQEALETNPLLEVEEEVDYTQQQDTIESDSQADFQTDSSQLEHRDIPEELTTDSQWEDTFDLPMTKTTPSLQSTTDLTLADNADPQQNSLQAHLLWQMRLTPFSALEQAIATAIIDAIDDNGYCQSSLSEIQQTLSLTPAPPLEEIEAVLHRLQHFDPIGVGARNLQECLLIQLQQYPTTEAYTPLVTQLVTEYLDHLAKRDYQTIQRGMQINEAQLTELVKTIQCLNPRPGRQQAIEQSQYIVPDVYVRKVGQHWRLSLNPDNNPNLQVADHYAQLIKRADNSSDNIYLKNHLQEARWFLKSLQSRNETLLKVTQAIIDHQQDFLEHGDVAMRPLILNAIAEEVDMHESTISRVTTRKYLHTPRGIYELKHFFSSHVQTDSGGECAATAIHAIIKAIVQEENPRKPLSDNKIAQLLGEKGIKVARRTIAKYREALAIPPSNERKRLV